MISLTLSKMAYKATTTKEIGAIGEAVALEWLRVSGYNVTAPLGEKSGDLLTYDNDCYERIEVKTAKQRSDGKFVFHLRTKKKSGKYATNIDYSDFVMLLPITKSGIPYGFIIPVCCINPAVATLCISKHPQDYSGVWSVWRQSTSKVMRLKKQP